MEITYLGHAAFKIISDSGVSIITDPYTPGDKFMLGEIIESADIVTISHDHFDHNNLSTIKGNPQIVRKAGETKIKNIGIKGISSYHDEETGKQRGNNLIFCFDVDGMKVCHLGDLGHQLTDAQKKEMGRVDIMLVPVGGYFTIDAQIATKLVDAVKPAVVIPMHYKTEKVDLPIAPVDSFLQGKKNVKNISGNKTRFETGKLPSSTQIVVLKTAL